MLSLLCGRICCFHFVKMVSMWGNNVVVLNSMGVIESELRVFDGCRTILLILLLVLITLYLLFDLGVGFVVVGVVEFVEVEFVFR